MKISLAWLNTYLDRPIRGEEAEHVLTAVGFPLDGREPLADGDELLDVEVTSNRGDCLSHVGVAREVAAASGRTLRLPDVTLPSETGSVRDAAALQLVAPDACPLYTARVIRGVKVGPSPAWLRQRLEAIGLRSVNNIVDITNFVLHELGQPLHAFDLAKLRGRRVVVRLADSGETFTAIDGTEHTLSSSMLVIADEASPVAVAGVMGGLDSEVGATTADILLESAMFDPLSVRRTSRALKLASDSSYRFERGVDPAGVDTASRRAAKLIVDIAGGTVLGGVLCDGPLVAASEGAGCPGAGAEVRLRLSRCTQVLGRTVTRERAMAILSSLQLSATLAGEDTITCRVPTFRRDLTREIDLIEEVARLDGYERIAVSDRLSLEVRPPQASVSAMRELRRVMVGHGYHETVTFSFVAPEQGRAFLPSGATGVELDDARRKREPMLRPSLLPSLLACRKTNQDAGNGGVRLFETAAVYCRVDGKIVESRRLGLVCDAEAGQLQQALRDVRGTLEELAVAMHGEAIAVTPTDAPGFALAAGLTLGGEPLGVMGLIDGSVTRHFDLQATVVAGELELEPLMARFPPTRRVEELSRYPGIERDLSVVVVESVRWDDMAAAVRSSHLALVESLSFVGTYRGKPIEKGRKSVTMRLRFRDPSRTLRHDEVDPQMTKALEALKAAVAAELRT